MLNDLKEIIAIKSVLDEQTAGKGKPFGKGCREALDWFLKKAKSYGLKTGEMDGYCGWAELGEGAECVAALCHLDVVPEGEGWTGDPYKLLTEDGKLFGRGVADDKGAAVMCLHALKEIKQAGVQTGKRLRVIVGLNEEHGSACIAHYVKNGGEIPVMSFVPDSDFPLINSEKGILHMDVSMPLGKLLQNSIAHISGSGNYNVVPGRASVGIFRDSPLGETLLALAGGSLVTKDVFKTPALVGAILASKSNPESFSIKNEGEVISIEAEGTAGHASLPHKADNAVWKIVTVLDALAHGESKALSVLKEYFCTPLAAQKLGIFKSDEVSGELTISLGMIHADDDFLNFTLDLRLPISAKDGEVKKAIAAVLPAHSKAEVARFSPNLYIDSSSPLVQTLLAAYEKVTGEQGRCMYCGGGTYARALPNAVAFGPTFAGRTTNLHNANEHLLVDDFFKAAEIYKETFIALAAKSQL